MGIQSPLIVTSSLYNALGMVMKEQTFTSFSFELSHNRVKQAENIYITHILHT